MVHCLALPALIAVFPLLGATLLDHESFHQIILIAVVPTTTMALGAGYRRHRNRPVALLGVIGIAALVYAAFTLHASHAHTMETLVTVVGGLLLSVAHIMNYRRCGHRHRMTRRIARHEQG